MNSHSSTLHVPAHAIAVRTAKAPFARRLSSVYKPFILLAALGAGASAGWLSAHPANDTHPDAVAVANLTPAAHREVVGTVQFIPTKDGVRVLAHVMNLSPGAHGFHIHEKGDLSAPDLSSAGGHFNPEDAPHGGRDASRRHVGDLGNLRADSSGVARLDYIDKNLSLEGEHSIIGRSVIVHAKPDDLRSQPSGDAGDRVAGGVIEKK